MEWLRLLTCLASRLFPYFLARVLPSAACNEFVRKNGIIALVASVKESRAPLGECDVGVLDLWKFISRLSEVARLFWGRLPKLHQPYSIGTAPSKFLALPRCEDTEKAPTACHVGRNRFDKHVPSIHLLCCHQCQAQLTKHLADLGCSS